MRKVLVTGGTGFLGKRLAITLKELGYDVTATGRNTKAGQELENQGITFVKNDLSDEITTVAICKNKEYVFHCGALSASWGPYEDFYQSNVIGTKNIIKGCHTHGVNRLIHTSSPSIYAMNKDTFGVKETATLPKVKVNAYAETKYEAEKLIDAAYENGLPVISIRPRAIFGPNDSNILPRLLQANKEKKLPFIRGGKALIDVTYVDNVVTALLKCMNSPVETLGKTYNITNGEPMRFSTLVEQLFTKLDERIYRKDIPYPIAYSLASLLEFIAKIRRSDEEPMLTRTTVQMLGRSVTLDISKAEKELNYKPEISVADGIDAYVESIKSI